MTTIKTYGMRGEEDVQDLSDLFTKSDLFGALNDLKHHPFLAIVPRRYDENETVPHVSIRIIRNAAGLLELRDDVLILAQWPGHWRSDWFAFTVEQWRAHLDGTLLANEAGRKMYESLRVTEAVIGPDWVKLPAEERAKWAEAEKGFASTV